MISAVVVTTIHDDMCTSTAASQANMCLVCLYYCWQIVTDCYIVDQQFNPLKGSGVTWLHFEVFSVIQV